MCWVFNNLKLLVALWLRSVELVWAHLQAAPGWHAGQPGSQQQQLLCWLHSSVYSML